MPELEQSQPQEIDLKEPIEEIKEIISISGFSITPSEPQPAPKVEHEPIAVIDGRLVNAICKVNGKFAFSEKEKESIIKIEKIRTDELVIEELNLEYIKATEGVKYASVDEALEHIKGATPQSLTIPYLKEQLQTAEAWLAAALTKLDTVETVSATLAEKVEALEVKTADTVEEPIKVADEPIIKK